MISLDIIEAVTAHGRETFPREACGVVVVFKGRAQYRRCRNVAAADENFVIDPVDYAAAEDAGEVIAIAHTHCGLPPEPSMADRVGIERSGVQWLIVNIPLGTYSITSPSGYEPPLIGRPFVHGVLDCYGLVRDWYRQELHISLPDFPRASQWWEKGQNLIVEGFAAAGFRAVRLDDMKVNDGLILRVCAAVPNHCAVVVGDNIIAHHAAGRLSSRDVYGGWLRAVTTHCLRHEAFA